MTCPASCDIRGGSFHGEAPRGVVGADAAAREVGGRSEDELRSRIWTGGDRGIGWEPRVLLFLHFSKTDFFFWNLLKFFFFLSSFIA